MNWQEGGRGGNLGRLLKYSKHFNSLLCICSKIFDFLRNCYFKVVLQKAP